MAAGQRTREVTWLVGSLGWQWAIRSRMTAVIAAGHLGRVASEEEEPIRRPEREM